MGIIIGVGIVVIHLFSNFRKTFSEYANAHFVALVQMLIIIITSLFVLFAVLNTLEVPPNTLLVGGGFLSIVIGLIVSTLFGNIIAGAVLLTTYPFKVGDNVIVNNVTGRILEITSFYTRILNTSGSETVIPNAAIIQGTAVVSKLSADDSSLSTRLHYSVGDKIYTNYIGGEGTVVEITPLHTKVHLDSGRVARIPNNSIFSGAVQIATVGAKSGALTLTLKVDGNAEKAIEAMKVVAGRDKSVYKSPPAVLYSSLDGSIVELKVSCEVDPSRLEEARSSLLRAAYSASHQS
ncbi:MAG: mechanosensitive ion channel family protein [Nitrososphaerales archaeon]|nr:mechanosensitive ion channel family protein [Nitrososphaerales archaeon]